MLQGRVEAFLKQQQQQAGPYTSPLFISTREFF
jgi:hypothetical protein